MVSKDGEKCFHLYFIVMAKIYRCIVLYPLYCIVSDKEVASSNQRQDKIRYDNDKDKTNDNDNNKDNDDEARQRQRTKNTEAKTIYTKTNTKRQYDKDKDKTTIMSLPSRRDCDKKAPV
jgi:hypothetical protein